MAGGSLRNSIHRRNHKERSQLSHRAKFGILEKHQDYVRRARDYHSKQDRIKRLQEKAAERNKDEFYFAMNRSRTKSGVHVQDRGNVALPVDIVKVLKSQDANYIRTMKNTGRKKIANLARQLTSLVDITPNTEATGMQSDEDVPADAGPSSMNNDQLKVLQECGVLPAPSSRKGKSKSSATPKSSRHVIFVGNQDEVRTYTPPASRIANETDSNSSSTAIPDLGWISNKSKSKAPDSRLTEEPKGQPSTALTVESKEHKAHIIKELAARLKRDTSLKYSLAELETQRLMMGKGARQKLHEREKITDEREDSDEAETRPSKGEYRPKVFKWRAERKR